jgi:hypothetical protein
MSGIPSLTILSEEQKFNGNNLLQWKTNITQLLGLKGLLGYIDGKIPKPDSPSPTSTSTTPKAKAPAVNSTAIYSSTPTLDEWIFRDQLTRGHITLNFTDVTGLGVKTEGTAKEAWESILTEWGKSTDMQHSHAQEALNRTLYVEGSDIQEHIKLLRMRKAAVDNLATTPMDDETWRGLIIRSIPPTMKWLPVIPSLYAMNSSADIVSTLLAHGMILSQEPGHRVANSSSTALSARTPSDGCTNPNCKAKKRTTHNTANCYWPGGGKEGQFPPNFGQRTKANAASSTAGQTTTTRSQPAVEHMGSGPLSDAFVAAATDGSTAGQKRCVKAPAGSSSMEVRQSIHVALAKTKPTSTESSVQVIARPGGQPVPGYASQSLLPVAEETRTVSRQSHRPMDPLRNSADFWGPDESVGQQGNLSGSQAFSNERCPWIYMSWTQP